MGKLHACLFVALVACGSDNEKKPDAFVPQDAPIDTKVWMDAPIDAPPMFDFACYGDAKPTTTSNANVTASGTLTEVTISSAGPSTAMIDGATVDACTGNCNGPNKLATSTTAGGGLWSDGPIPTSGAPVDAYLKMTPPNSGAGSTDLPVLEYPGEPLGADLSGIPLLTFTSSSLSFLALVGCTQSTANGLLAIAVTDCSNMPITDSAHVTITVMQNGSPVSVTPIDLGAANAQAKGTFLVCNVPPNPTTNVGATYTSPTMTYTLLAHDMQVVANTITAAQIRPGY